MCVVGFAGSVGRASRARQWPARKAAFAFGESGSARQGAHQRGRGWRQWGVGARGNAVRAPRPGVAQGHGRQRQVRQLRRDGLQRQHAHAQAGGHHAADGVEAAHAHAHVERAARVGGRGEQAVGQRGAVAQRDEGLVQRVGQAQLLAAREAVRSRRQQHQRVAEEGREGQARRRHRQVNHAEIGTPLDQRQRDLGAAALLDVDADQRVAGEEALQPLRQHLQQSGGVGQHAHLALQALAVALQVLGQAVGVGQQRAAALHQHLAGRRELHAARGALEDAETQCVFQRGDTRTGRGHRQVQAFAGGADGAQVGGGDHHAQRAEVDGLVHAAVACPGLSPGGRGDGRSARAPGPAPCRPGCCAPRASRAGSAPRTRPSRCWGESPAAR